MNRVNTSPSIDERHQLRSAPRKVRVTRERYPAWQRRYTSTRGIIALLTLGAFLLPGVAGVILAALSAW